MSRRTIVGAFGVLLAAVLVLGTVDTFVWMPQYLAPGISLSRIYAALSASGDLPYIVANAVGWLVFWSLLTGIYSALLLPASRFFRPMSDAARPIVAAAIGALLLGATGFFQWWSAFGMGMSVSDELPPGVGGTTPLGLVIAGGGLLVGLVGLLLGVVALATRPKPAPATP